MLSGLRFEVPDKAETAPDVFYTSRRREKIIGNLGTSKYRVIRKKDGNKESLTDTTQEHTDKGAMEFLRPTYDRS